MENYLLDALPESELAQIRPFLRTVTLHGREILYPAGSRHTKVYFPAGAALSLLAVMQDGDAVEIGTFGREGLSGTQLLLGEDNFRSQMICQIPGVTHYIDTREFLRLMNTTVVFRRFAQKYTIAQWNLMGQSIACNRLHRVDERCAKSLLLSHDRVARDTFEITQEFLAMMLGVHRQGVSMAAARLQELELIRYRRGRMEVLNRQGLEARSCECYGVSAYEFERVFTTAAEDREVVAF